MSSFTTLTTPSPPLIARTTHDAIDNKMTAIDENVSAQESATTKPTAATARPKPRGLGKRQKMAGDQAVAVPVSMQPLTSHDAADNAGMNDDQEDDDSTRELAMDETVAASEDAQLRQVYLCACDHLGMRLRLRLDVDVDMCYCTYLIDMHVS